MEGKWGREGKWRKVGREGGRGPVGRVGQRLTGHGTCGGGMGRKDGGAQRKGRG